MKIEKVYIVIHANSASWPHPVLSTYRTREAAAWRIKALMNHPAIVGLPREDRPRLFIVEQKVRE